MRRASPSPGTPFSVLNRSDNERIAAAEPFCTLLTPASRSRPSTCPVPGAISRDGISRPDVLKPHVSLEVLVVSIFFETAHSP
jgi:hypothetical protein